MKRRPLQFGPPVLLLAAVIAVGLTGVQPAPVTAALWDPRPLPGAQQVEFRRTVSRCMTTLAELTGFNGDLRDGQRAQPGMWASTYSQSQPPILILTLDPLASIGLPHPLARLSRHVLNLPPPLL